MGVLPEIGKAVDDMGWLLPTDVQAEAIPAILGGGDVLMVISKTNKVGMSFFDRGSALAVSADGMTCQCREQRAWHGCRASFGVRNSGKYYYEGIVTDEGLCRLGWSTLAGTLELGVDREGFGFGGTGKKSYGKQFDDYGQPFGMHDVIGCFLDLDNYSIRYSKNGIEIDDFSFKVLFALNNVFFRFYILGMDLGEAYTIPDKLKRSSFFPAVVLKNAEMKFNFGAEPFKFPPGCGFTGLPNASPSCLIANTNADLSKPQAVIRNSAQAIIIETYQQVLNFGKALKDPVVRGLLVIGGQAAREQISAIANGVDIIVATPGRLNDLISTGQLMLSGDGLLNQGYGDMIRSIHRQIPKFTNDGKRMQMTVCSATLHSFEVKKLADSIMKFPTWIDLKGQDSVPETVHHVVCMVNPRKDTLWAKLKKHIATDRVHQEDHVQPGNNSAETMSEAIKILKGEYVVRAVQEHKMDQALIFCRTKLDCDNMERYMNMQGRSNTFSCVCLHSDRAPAERKANLSKFKSGQVKFLICTDVAARGIDIIGVPYVINVTLPDEKSNYIHRIGRVGRAERMGLAISLVSEIPEKVWYHSNCNNRGKNCWNTNLTDNGGCCIWYDEPRYLGEIEEHLGVVIQQTGTDLKVTSDEFDGKVTYGQKRKDLGSNYVNHVGDMSNAVDQLASLETEAQSLFIKRHFLNDKSWLVK
ncbi:ATP-dependent RNA helicase DDX1 [Nymphon striatum]|nr:ATP-dependent RNA helicase DDX1 [Nymphon striatum]